MNSAVQDNDTLDQPAKPPPDDGVQPRASRFLHRDLPDRSASRDELTRTLGTLLMVLLPVAVGLLLPQPVLVPAPFNLLGILLLTGGVALVLWTWSFMKAAATTLRPGEQSSFLLTSGPFRISRNPMYLGALLAVLGESVLMGSLASLLIPVGYFVGVDQFVARYEEIPMAAQFGDAYHEYARRVRRWL